MNARSNGVSDLRRFARTRVQNAWVDVIREQLCRILNERRQFITIFDFDSEDHHGRLEDAILDAVFKGPFLLLISIRNDTVADSLAAKFTQEPNGQHRSIAELRLALVSKDRAVQIHNALLRFD